MADTRHSQPPTTIQQPPLPPGAGIERIIAALVPLGGLLWGWPAAPMALFVVLGLLSHLIDSAITLLIYGRGGRGRVSLLQEALDRRREEEEQEREEREGPSTADNRPIPPRLSPPWQWAAAAWVTLSLVGAVLYQMEDSAGVALLEVAREEPAMIAVMAAAAAAAGFAPLLEAILGMVLMLFWLAGSTIVVNLARIVPAIDPEQAVLLAFVIAASLIELWRGTMELRTEAEARALRRRLQPLRRPD